MKRISVKNNDLERRLIQGMDALSNAIDDSIHDAIITPQDWPQGFGVTRRKNGEIVSGSYRNIVDLGSLDGSQDMNRNDLKTTWEWDGLGETPAALVYSGYATKNGNVPERHFPEKGIENVDIAEEFKKGFNEN